MEDHYIKPSILEWEYQGAKSTIGFEGMRNHLTISMKNLISSDNLANWLKIENYSRWNDPVAFNINMQLKIVENHLNSDGKMTFHMEHESSDPIFFGLSFDLKN